MFSRRSFLKVSVALASGIILPSWLQKAERYIQLEGKPYIETPNLSNEILYACTSFSDQVTGYELYLGNPSEEPNTDLTWESFLETYQGAIFDYEWVTNSNGGPPHLNHKVDPFIVLSRWEDEGCPCRKAYKFLESIDLGEELGSGTKGSINFYDGFSPAHDAKIVSASDLLSLSLLQQRLNYIDSHVAIKLIQI